MQLMDFSAMRLLSVGKASELCEAINRTNEGQRVVGVWCSQTGFAVRVVVVAGVPLQWFIRGPLTIDQAREELMMPSAAPTGSIH